MQSRCDSDGCPAYKDLSGQKTQFLHVWREGLAGTISSIQSPIAAQDSQQWQLKTAINRTYHCSKETWETAVVFQAVVSLLYCLSKSSLTNSDHMRTLRDLVLTQNHIFWIFVIIWGSKPLLVLPSLEVLGSLKPVTIFPVIPNISLLSINPL